MEGARRQPRHLVHGLLEREQPALAAVVRQHTRKSAPQARVRVAVVRQTVRADHRQRVHDDLVHIVVVHLEVAGAARLQATAGLLLRHTPIGRDLGQQPPVGLGVRVRPGDTDVDHAVDQVLAQHRRAGGVRVDVHRHTLPRRQCFDQRQRLTCAAPLRGSGALVVRDHQRHAGRPRGVRSLVQRFDDGLHLAAQVRGVDAAVAGHHLRQRQHFRGRRGKSGFVEQARRQADGPVVQTLVQQRGHTRQLFGAGRTVEPAHRRHTQRGVADQCSDVDRRARGRQRSPVVGHAGVAERLRAEQVQRRWRGIGEQRRQRDAAVAGDHRRHALRDLGQHLRLLQQHSVVVGVHVDEARCHNQAAAVEHLGVARAAAKAGADGFDAVTDHQQVGDEARCASPVDDKTAFEQSPWRVGHQLWKIKNTSSGHQQPDSRHRPPASSAIYRRSCTGEKCPAPHGRRRPGRGRPGSADRHAGRSTR